MLHRYAIKFAYLGANYQGFQRQKKTIITIEGTILEILKSLNITSKVKSSRYSAAGRTDKGVNAISQVIAIDSLKEEIYLEEINQHLPNDIYAWAIAKVHDSFNARRDATSRVYRYYHMYSNENLELMNEGIKKLLGTHDFIKLCKKPDILASGYQKSTILRLDAANVKLIDMKSTLEFEFVSRSFLWNQVRKMVSLLLDVGKGKYELGKIDEVLNPKSKLPKGGIKPAPPIGLVLYDVKYPEIKFESIKKKEVIESRIKEKLSYSKSMTSILNLMKSDILK